MMLYSTHNGLNMSRKMKKKIDYISHIQSILFAYKISVFFFFMYKCSYRLYLNQKINFSIFFVRYLDNRVFVALANGDICVYLRDGAAWNTTSSHCLSVGTVTSPVTKLLSVHGRLWCSIQGIIKVLDIETLAVN